jgi:hypothetical protein
MTSRADWIVVAGFVLAVLGLGLRILMMMRSSDAHPANAGGKPGRDLLRGYSASYPKSRLPMAMWIALTLGLVLLLAGFLLEFR